MDAYYPYTKEQDYLNMAGAGELIGNVVDYLMDLPSAGYAPPDDNDYPRCRLMKYLYHDGELPLSRPLPTPGEKLSLLFDPQAPANPPTEKGYRIFPQLYFFQAQLSGQTILKVYMGRTVAVSAYRAEQAVVFEILTNSVYEGNTNSTQLSRTYAMGMDIIRALNGVNIKGVGTFYFDRRQHSDCGMSPISDEFSNIGYKLTMGCSFIGGK